MLDDTLAPDAILELLARGPDRLKDDLAREPRVWIIRQIVRYKRARQDPARNI